MSDKHPELSRKLKSAYEFGPDFPHRMLLSRIVADLDRAPEGSRRPVWLVGLAASTAVVMIVAGLIWFTPATEPNMQSPIEAPSSHSQESGLGAILANNHLAYLAPGATHPQWDISIAPPPNLNSSHGYAGLGRRVAASPDHASIYALPAADFRGGDTLVVVSVRDGTVVHRIKLPNPDRSARYGALAVGPSGDIWVVGSIGKQIEIVRIKPGDWSVSSWAGRDMSYWVAQGPVSGDFSIYEVQVVNNEQRVFYSYTGGRLDLAGLDWTDISGQRAITCTPAKPAESCVPSLAGFLVQGSKIYVTTANDSPSGAIDYYTLDGTLRAHIQLGLLPGFLEDFTLAPDGRSLYLLGSCGYSGGMAKLNLATNESTVIVKAESQYTHSANPPCGQSSAFVSANLVAVGHVNALVPSEAEGTILYVDSRSGSVGRSVVVSAEPIAVAAT